MTDFKLIHTNSNDAAFIELAAALEAELYQRDGAFAEFNKNLNRIDFIPDVVVLYADNDPVACGAFRALDHDSVEIKRMYVKPGYRRNKLASAILQELENTARKSGFRYCLLETGITQPEAIALYRRQGYEQIPNFGKYIGSSNSVCFKKQL